MKIVIATDCFLPRWDGVARFLDEFLPFISEHEVTVFAPDFGNSVTVPKNVRIVRFPLMSMQFADIQFSKPDKKLMRDVIKNSDVVFNQTIGPVGKNAILAAKKFKKPVVSFVHSLEWKLVYSAIKRFKSFCSWVVKRRAKKLYNKCSLLIVPSHEVEDRLASIGVKSRKKVVHLGVDVDHFSPTHSKAVAKRNANIDPKQFVVGFCGRIAREKDVPTLVDGFHKARKRIPESVLLIVGEGLENEIRSSKYVLRVGHQNNVVPFLQAMDVFVLPSLTETSSLATMEAMACGVPPVVTPVGSLREYVIDGENGFFFPRGDSEILSEKLIKLLADSALRASMGGAARKTIVNDYNWKNSAARIVQCLKKAAKFL